MKNFFKKLFCSDSWSKNFSETVRRVGKNNAGFSLVELIVVIAIMAILAAVAVVGVSVYIPKAQKAADEQMIADVQKAIDLYTAGETLTPGQSGYVVVHKAGGVSVGGDMGTVLTEALVATFGEGYTSELKVAYPKWTSFMPVEDIQAIQNSQFIKDVYSDSGILGTVDMLTGAMKLYYGGNANAQEMANQTVLDIAAATKNNIDKEKLITWWTTVDLMTMPTNDIFKEGQVPSGSNEATKILMAAWYARGKAFVDFTGCSTCKSTFESTDFDNIENAGAAVDELLAVLKATETHVGQCTDVCAPAISRYYAESARSDAEAYVAALGQIDSMSDTIKESEEFGKDGLYTSGFVKDLVGEYMTSINAYSAANAQDGDIVLTILVDQYGNLRYTSNLTE